MLDITVGIPRGLFFYTFYPMWKTFFHELGVRVIVSPQTTKSILDAGVEETVTDACIPIKVYHGHVEALKEQADYIFIPRMVNYRGKQTFCPKFLGLPDMVRYSLQGLPPIISPRVAVRGSKKRLLEAFYETGIYFTDDRKRTRQAGEAALKAHQNYHAMLQGGMSVRNALRALDNQSAKEKPNEQTDSLRLAILGYPYIINDQYISMNLTEHLENYGVEYFTYENLPFDAVYKHKYWSSKSVFWYFSDTILRAAAYVFDGHVPVDGVIHVTAFGCGPDFLVNRLLEGQAKEKGIPFLTATIDEQSGSSGMLTRLEAFCDMISRQQRLEGGNTSA